MILLVKKIDSKYKLKLYNVILLLYFIKIKF